MLINSSRPDVLSYTSCIEVPPPASRESSPKPWVAVGLRDGLHPTVEISPCNAVRRGVLTWRGVTAESVQCTGDERTKLHFRAPMHLLVAYEEGERRNGDTFVEGLPRSTLRH